MDYSGNGLTGTEQIRILNDLDGHAQLSIDTAEISVSQAIRDISSQVDIQDLSVTGETIDEMVVSLYQEFAI